MWISKNQIKKIVEKEYLNKEMDSLHFFSIYHYNDNGYLIKKENSLAYPNEDSLFENIIASYAIYSYDTINSFLVQEEKYVIFYNEFHILLDEPTILTSKTYYNIFKLDKKVDANNKIDEIYQFDNEGRIIFVKGFQSRASRKISYTKNTIVLESEIGGLFINNQPATKVVTIYFNDSGKIFKSEGKGFVYQYTYNPNNYLFKLEEISKNDDNIIVRIYKYYNEW